MKKKIFAGILALAAVLALVCIIFAQGGSGTYVPAADEIALRIQFDTKEDVGLLVYDYRAEDRDYSGGISNADGSLLPGGKSIKKGKLRGVESCGMMCSIEELGSTRDMYPEAPEYGIYIFPEDAQVGASAIEALGLNDSVFEYEVTSNRVDCFSVIGIAREAAATFRKEFKPPVVTPTGNGEDVNDYVKVTVENTDLCPRYCARVVKNIKIGPSPKWMQRRLASVGIRPINNLVDITNYVMEEYGQPMHAYDLDTIADHHIVVKTAKNGEKFVTLDGQERTMDEDVLMICDGEKAIGLAGIMGGENSMITDNVQTMLFEAACFDGVNIRKSSKRVGLRTDASAKFEKGLDPNNAQAAIDRACQLVEEMGAGEVVGGMVDVYGKKKEPVRVPFDADKVNAMLGTPYAIRFPVQHGAGLGRTLGVPTINQIYPEGYQLPRYGIYITRTWIKGRAYPSATGLGTRPTVNDDSTKVTCETFIPGFYGDLYGTDPVVEFHTYLSPSKKFDTLDELRDCIRHAARRAEEYFRK